MARELHCRWEGCRATYTSVAGDLPGTCPGCSQPGRWTVVAPLEAAADAAWQESLNLNDRRLLTSLRISSA